MRTLSKCARLAKMQIVCATRRHIFVAVFACSALRVEHSAESQFYGCDDAVRARVRALAKHMRDSARATSNWRARTLASARKRHAGYNIFPLGTQTTAAAHEAARKSRRALRSRSVRAAPLARFARLSSAQMLRRFPTLNAQ